ncbi:MAG: PHP domain-containing protein [Nanoarchaeota archaeon]|nr:PHP domain-containing protein [Nanoarchaeota archaeon]
MLKFDFHVHTLQGDHSRIEVKKAVQILKSKGFDGAAFVDHDAIPERINVKDFLTIYGEEISTKQGHLLGLNIKTSIKPLMSAEITAKEIIKQGGVVIVPHPYDYMRIAINRGRLNPKFIHAVETRNARTLWPLASSNADVFAEKHGLPKVGGSDAHFYKELGNAFTLVDSKKTVNAVLEAVKRGKTQSFGKYSPPILQHVKGGFLKAYNRFLRKRFKKEG